jgi:hypothetical protein
MLNEGSEGLTLATQFGGNEIAGGVSNLSYNLIIY